MVRLHPWPWWWEEEQKVFEDLAPIHNQKLLIAGAASLIATALLHPLELLKVRIQISAKPYPVQVMYKRVMISEGYKGLYKGLSAGLFRQASHTFTRLGVYNYLNELSKTKNNRPLLQWSMQDRVKVGVYSGMAGAIVGNPAELLLIRMMASSKCQHLAHECVRDMNLRRHPYKGCVDGIRRIVREEGVLTLWRGTTLTLLRSVVINTCQISSYLWVRERVIRQGVFNEDNKMEVHAVSCVVSSLIGSVMSLPVDVLKSWYQIRHGNSSIREVASCLTHSKGKMFLWSGFGPYYLRMCAYTIITYYLFTEFSEFIKAHKQEIDKIKEESSERTPLVAQKIDSLAKLLFNKSIIGAGSGKSSPSEPHPASPKIEQTIETSAALAICSEYLSERSRYGLVAQLGRVGSRPNKHWFVIHDHDIKTERLLTLLPLSSSCPIERTASHAVVLQLFRALHHPYICPVLDLEVCSHHALAVLPTNTRGTLKDLIYKSTWSEEFSRKYSTPGTGLPSWQVSTFGRQLLEGLLFLKEKGFEPFTHLHSGNVIVQNGVARICGLENTLIGCLPHSPAAMVAPPDRVEAVTLGAVLYEMCAGAELDLAMLQELPSEYSSVVEIVEQIFGPRPPALHELLLCDLFRKIDLREMKGSCLPNFNQRLSRSCLSLLNEITQRNPSSVPQSPRTASGPQSPRSWRSGPGSPATPPARRRHYPLGLDQDYTEEWQW